MNTDDFAQLERAGKVDDRAGQGEQTEFAPHFEE
jgi:hypothetical protein